jgi:dihydrofolate reductase
MMSIDGCIAGQNDEMDWLPPFNDETLWEDIHEEMWNQLKKVDTILLGRKTYQVWKKYWPAAGANPSSSKNNINFSRYADETQKIVFSKTLEKAEWNNTRLIKNNITEEISNLKQLPGKNISLAGGAGIAQTFMNLDLIDEYVFTVHPVILGKGKFLFKNIMDRKRLKLIGTKSYKSKAIELHYQAIKNGEG